MKNTLEILLLAPFAVLIRYEEGYEVTLEEARSLSEKTKRLRQKILAEIRK